MVYKSSGDEVGENSYLYNKFFMADKYELDYMRYRTFEMCAKELNKSAIIGAVAEFGVFKGDFATLINRSFPDRKLYLYDSFEGFKENELLSETSMNSYIITEEKNSLTKFLNIKM